MEAADAASLAVHTQDLAKRYGKTVALSGLTMSVRRAEVFGFLGPNGAGKTTAVKLLVGLALPTAGEGWVLGAPIGDLQTRRRLGYLPELFRYQGWMKAREVLGLHCKLSGMARSEWKKEIDVALELVGLSDRADDKVEGFSKGMQQRLGLGVALLGRPELVLLDEPTSALDPVGRHDVREIIRTLKARGTSPPQRGRAGLRPAGGGRPRPRDRERDDVADPGAGRGGSRSCDGAGRGRARGT